MHFKTIKMGAGKKTFLSIPVFFQNLFFKMLTFQAYRQYLH